MSETLNVIIDSIDRESDEVVSLTLRAEDGGSLPDAAPGAHLDLHLPGGLIRQYSLFEVPDGSCYRVAVKLEPNSRGGSRAVHEDLVAGESIAISPPRNNFALDDSASDSILLAGGIGITPLLAMAQELAAQGRSFALHYFTRTPQVTAFRDRIAASVLAQKTTHHYGLDADGVAAALSELVGQYQPGTHLYLCGPAPFIDAVRSITAGIWPDEAVHLEYFSADAPQLAEGGDSFEVHLAKSDLSFTIPSEKSIAEVLLENGIDIEVSCEQGVCGTCLTRVLEGTPVHEDVYMSDDEHNRNDQMTICVSRCSGGKLVLDL